MQGIYAMYYTGETGSGHALFVMKDGEITGADVIGGMLDGTFITNEDNSLSFEVEMTVPGGSTLVTGQTAGLEPLKQTITAKLPENFADGKPYPIRTPLGPVNVIFRFLRGLK